MQDLYIIKASLNKWVAKYFPKQDLISINDLIAKIEELDEDIQRLEEENNKLQNKDQDDLGEIDRAYERWRENQE